MELLVAMHNTASTIASLAFWLVLPFIIILMVRRRSRRRIQEAKRDSSLDS